MTKTVATTRDRGLLGWIALGAALASLLGLGTWQLQRRVWKEGVLADMAARAGAPPLAALPAVGCTECDFRRIAITGRLVPDSERHIFISVPRQANGVGGPGYWVFAQLETGGQTLYVNRGFVPQADKTRPRAVSGGSTMPIDGIVRLPEPRGRFSNANDTAGNVYYVRAPAEFLGRSTTGVRTDLYIDMTGPITASGQPLPMVGKIAIPNRHLEYALTWYALALTLIGVVIARTRGMNRR